MLPDGALWGGDWGYPLTGQQAYNFIERTTWNSNVNFGGAQTYLLIAIYYAELIKLLYGFGVDIQYFIKIMIALTVAVSFFGFYYFLKTFKIGIVGSLSGALFYAISPILFNWIIMGWQFALISIALAPFALKYFLKAIDRNQFYYLLITLIIWIIAAMQSQAIIWYFIIFFVASLTLAEDKLRSFKFLFVLCLLFALLNMFWFVPSFVLMDQNIFSGEIVKSEISRGADLRFTPLNSLKLWGSLFNFQFETSQGKLLGNLSVFLPIISILGYLLSNKKQIKISLFLIIIAYIVPAIALLLSYNREFLSIIPGSGIIRQTSRFLVISLFGFSGLIALYINSLLSTKNKFAKLIVLFSLLIIFIVYLNPWYHQEIVEKRAAPSGADNRLKVVNFSNDYFEAEKFLKELKLNTRAIYFPTGMTQSLTDNMLFNGPYNEAIDVFAALSPVPGAIIKTDRFRSNANFLDMLVDDPVHKYHDTSIQLFVFRKNMKSNGISGKYYLDNFLKSKDFHIIFNSHDVVILSRKDAISNIYVDKQIYNNQDTTIEFKKVSSTKTLINLHSASGVVPLVFGESFSNGWRLYPINYVGHEIRSSSEYDTDFVTDQFAADVNERGRMFSRKILSNIGPLYISKNLHQSIQNENLSDRFDFDPFNSVFLDKEHSIYKNHANIWRIPVDSICETQGRCIKNSDGTFTTSFILYFYPQSFFEVLYPLTLISIFTLFVILTILVLVKNFKNLPD